MLKAVIDLPPHPVLTQLVCHHVKYVTRCCRFTRPHISPITLSCKYVTSRCRFFLFINTITLSYKYAICTVHFPYLLAHVFCHINMLQTVVHFPIISPITLSYNYVTSSCRFSLFINTITLS